MKATASSHQELEKNGVTVVFAKDRQAWRRWLQINSDKQKAAWLIIYHKSADTKTVYYEEAVEEALCFGWIDSKPNKRDAESFYLFFSVRKPKSNWSKSNKIRVERLIKDGLMTSKGLAAIEAAKNNGGWTALDQVSELIMPKELSAALEQNKTAKKYFDSFPASVKRGIYEWIINAKRPETKAKRIEETVRLAEQNIRANQYQPKPSAG